ncbi:metalloregulator ArsR/SmtB family transcription factor [Nitratireductor aquimarinus]|uniref:Metalloregulator ArsR/SmtB family transcription factor n=2 Tax=Alphaproteobacteria TaxID=28211 RepID=A0ABU4AJL5_9HYPH|nr:MULTISPECIES: metalloregulator ArsR/SmtB family transcription factor [Nitratireductor]MBY6020830.1 metalloregulator ArsR/SmtB family transcription factor [Nitratireductor sp. DP7N14-4]MBN7756044.1 winged helix-turn-helix transcriptional regulator [Nitratireductor aquimarinus]MBN7778666.1 winged helix-turn-helix transcriptional regulator [Nitratireductor pacificus]MBN7782989.1 winged helix-turn-helix transcriptional regulator [Nitratireductor pacificus]MBN7791795.1 winged helix-turn-helix tr
MARALSDECCPHQKLVQGFNALSHPARIKILKHLSGFDACCCKEVVQHLDLAQSTVSQHLKVLVEAGLVQVRPERQSSRYEVDTEALASLSEALSLLTQTCVDAKENKKLRLEAEANEQ